MTRTRLKTFALLLSVSAAACAHNKGASTPDFAAGSPSYSTEAMAEDSPTLSSPRADLGGASVGSDATPYDQPASEAEAIAQGGASVGGSAAPPPRSSPGLGTAYGETRYSKVHSVPFRRGTDTPNVLLSLRYNDPRGIADLSSIRGGARRPQATMQSDSLRVSLVGERGSVLPGAEIAGEVYAIGGVGQRYMIAVENHTTERYEVVASVDGLDVLDGDDASFSKRGYVVDPYTSFVIEGWRTGDETVAAFRFSELGESYAARTGRPRNVGVIGVAFFQENRPLDTYELNRRDSADPFPNRYAPPPPYRRY